MYPYPNPYAQPPQQQWLPFPQQPQKKTVKITASDFEALVNDIRNEEPEPQSEDEDS